MPEILTRKEWIKEVVLTTAYFPPIEYFALLARYSVVYMEACERYEKQSWRNRCRILSEKGPMDLNFPIVHDGEKSIRKVLVDWSTPWLARTEYAIDSAYMSSPYFEYYRDELFSIMDSRPDTLWEMNSGITDFFCRKIGIAPKILETSSFVPPVAVQSTEAQSFSQAEGLSVTSPNGYNPYVDDYRYSIHPKKPNTIMTDLDIQKPYWQVFADRFGFTPGLSILDLLFNEGPESLCWLR